MELLINEIKLKIIDRLNLMEVNPEDIKADDALFNDGLGLDSIDALELVVILETDYGIKVDEMESIRPHLKSLATLASFVDTSRQLQPQD